MNQCFINEYPVYIDYFEMDPPLNKLIYSTRSAEENKKIEDELRKNKYPICGRVRRLVIKNDYGIDLKIPFDFKIQKATNGNTLEVIFKDCYVVSTSCDIGNYIESGLQIYEWVALIWKTIEGDFEDIFKKKK